MSKSSAAKRHARRREVLPGFPWTGQFLTPESARDYVAGDRIQCLCCGRKLKALTTHLRMHSLDETSYKQMFGIPYGVPLCSSATSEKHRVSPSAQAGRERFLRDDIQAKAAQARHTPDFRPPVSSVTNQRLQRLAALAAVTHVQVPCQYCGNLVFGNPHYKQTCPECAASRPGAPGAPMTDAEKQRIAQWTKDNEQRASDYNKAKSWWTWQKNPIPLIQYAEKYNARLRIMPELLLRRKELSESA